jgi:hypothetical protein
MPIRKKLLGLIIQEKNLLRKRPSEKLVDKLLLNATTKSDNLLFFTGTCNLKAVSCQNIDKLPDPLALLMTQSVERL